MIALNRVSAWKKMSDTEFNGDFAETIRIADKFQPALLVATIALTAWFAITTHGIGQLLGSAAAVIQVTVLLASLIALVPLQNQLIADKTGNTVTLHAMRERWYMGHTGRTVLSLVMLALVVATAVVAGA